jgi:hypothetical protein
MRHARHFHREQRFGFQLMKFPSMKASVTQEQPFPEGDMLEAPTGIVILNKYLMYAQSQQMPPGPHVCLSVCLSRCR